MGPSSAWLTRRSASGQP